MDLRRTLMLASCFVMGATTLLRADSGEVPPPYKPPAVQQRDQWTQEKMVGFMRDLTEFIRDKHLVDDPNRRVYGMVYEFYEDGKQIQSFGLDTMHDGAWLASSMMTAHLVDPDGPYMEFARTYQIPFYTNVINNSDRIFRNKKLRQGQDNKPLAEPLKGWVPRGWDDGEGWNHRPLKQFKNLDLSGSRDSSVERDNGEFVQAYFTPSNHLAQDLAEMLLNVWMVTHDPDVKRAMDNLFSYREEYFGRIRVLRYAQGFMTDNKDLREWMLNQQFDPHSGVTYPGMYRQAGKGLHVSYDDPMAWQASAQVAEASRTGRPRPEPMWKFAHTAYDAANTMEMYFDDRPWPIGMFWFDLQGPPAFVKGTGKINKYMSEGGFVFGARGIQYAATAASILPALKAHPELWERRYRQEHSSDTLVRIVDDPPATDARQDRVYRASGEISADGVRVRLVSDPKNLHVLIRSSKPTVTLGISHAAANVYPPKHKGIVRVTRQGEVAVVNDADEAVSHESAFRGGDVWTAELRIPYTIMPSQAHWINGIDHGRYDVTVNDQPAGTVYMLSSPERVIRRLEELVIGTVATWHDIWTEAGCIPSSWRTHNRQHEGCDSGNYAHLIKTIARWLLYQQGTTEWDALRKNRPRRPIESELPRRTREVLGLE